MHLRRAHRTAQDVITGQDVVRTKALQVLAVILATLFCLPAPAGQDRGSLCVVPIPRDWPATFGAPGLICAMSKTSLKIDDEKVMKWPTKENIRIDGLDLAARHRVVVYCGEKPQQSFRFRFSDYNSEQLCLS
jgi:hypothetical protein